MAATINLNDNVYVKLTKKGRQMHWAYWEPFSGGKYQAPKTSIDGWSRFQLHELMHVFGPACKIGMGGPMETEIRLSGDGLIFVDPTASESKEPK